ncbi:hypothetical protein Acy02nite_01470 [Actinoplanes cyaneus]|uniref:Uncharacterized protein n=1 Tax=Actinoplanes cyaneus TaxID=52696 RepID=A0A919IBL1_9ACTN|nr:hypothetical protein Acy02nite_01470 [Actinoplanes cyaneus]
MAGSDTARRPETVRRHSGPSGLSLGWVRNAFRDNTDHLAPDVRRCVVKVAGGAPARFRATSRTVAVRAPAITA